MSQPRARELFRFIQAHKKAADEEPAQKKPRLAPSGEAHAEATIRIQYPDHDEIPRVDRPLPGNWHIVDQAMAKMFFVPSPSVSNLSCGIDSRNIAELKTLLDGANRRRVQAQLAPYAWATPRFLNRVMVRHIFNERTRQTTHSAGPWNFESIASSAIGYLTHDGHVDPGSVPFGPVVFGPEDVPATAPAGAAVPMTSASSGIAAPGAAPSGHPIAPTTGADGQQPANTSNERQLTHPWFQLLPTSGPVPLWYREQIDRLRAFSKSLPAPVAYDASISTGPRGAGEGPRVLRIRLSTITTARRLNMPAQSASSAAPGASAGPSSQAAAGLPAPQAESLLAISRTVQRAVFEERDPAFFQIEPGEQVHAWGLYYGDLCSPPAIGTFPGWSAWTGNGVPVPQQNSAASQRTDATAQQSSVSTQQNGVVQQPNGIGEQQSDAGSSEDSVEPISGLAARIIGAGQSYDRDSAAEARRYLNATRRASARSNSNSPHTPRHSNAFVLPGDASQRDSSLPPSDPPLDDTSSVAHEDDGVGRALSEPDVPPENSELGAYPPPDVNTGIDEDAGPSEASNAETMLATGRQAEAVANIAVPPILEVDEDEEAEGGGDQNPFTNAVPVVGDVAYNSREAAFSPPRAPPRRTTRSRSRQPVARPAPVPQRRSTRRAASKPPT